jgi:DNA-binding CsgD family transcriptional regulator
MEGYEPSLRGVLRQRAIDLAAWIRDFVFVLRPLPPGEIDPVSVLSPKEMTILLLLIQRKTEREIAFRLFISIDMVYRQRRVIARKLRVRRRDLHRVKLTES